MSMDSQNNTPADGLGLLGSVPGITATVSGQAEESTSVAQGSDLLDNVFDITNELYLMMRDPATGAEEDHLTIIRLLTDLGRRLVNADRASFWRLDEEAGTIWTVSATGSGKIEIPVGTGMVGKALAEGRTLVTNDPYHDPFFNPEVDKKTGYVTKSILVMPITNSRGEYIGAYQVINKLDGDGKFDLAATGLTAYSHGEYFTLGKKLGKFGYSVKKGREVGAHDPEKVSLQR